MAKEYKITTDVKGKILKTAAESIYIDTPIKIREAVTNSIDNKATAFFLTLNKAATKGSYTLSLFDNGDGIALKRFREILNHIGYGLHLDDKRPKNKYSHYGLGLMSVFELGKKVSVITKAIGTQNTLRMEVNSEKLFSKEMERESISQLNQCFKLYKADHAERGHLSPLTSDSIRSKLGKFPHSFTEFIIEDVTIQDLQSITTSDFQSTLSKLLPLRASDGSPLLEKLTPQHRKRILEILDNNKLCPTINFYCSLSDTDEHSEVFRHFPSFKHFSSTSYTFHAATEASFSYYLIVGRKALGTPSENIETGLWFRSKNVLVKGPDFLSYQGGSPVCDTIVGKWLFGEVFHENMIDFLDASRTNFKFSHQDFRAFKEEVRKIVSPKCAELRESYDKGHEIVDALERTYTDFKDEENSPLKKLEQKIAKAERLGEDEGHHEETSAKILKRFGTIHSSQLEKTEDFYESIDEAFEFTPEGMEQYTVRIDPAVSESSITKYEAIIPARIFQAFNYTFFGKQFKVRFVKSDIRQAVSFNLSKKPREITLNLAYPELLKYNISYIPLCQCE